MHARAAALAQYADRVLHEGPPLVVEKRFRPTTEASPAARGEEESGDHRIRHVSCIPHPAAPVGKGGGAEREWARSGWCLPATKWRVPVPVAFTGPRPSGV
ncbi:hypothetical protein GCM10010277_22990 [Streptomyces longisporoflavus]|nr:hypothetical protein GCM10010277_22990 [Streptomyces longisporoflavus]